MACTLGALAFAPAAGAFSLRSPQVAFNSGPLQGALTGYGESINVTTDQLDAQRWQSSVSGNSTFTLMVELTANAASNNIGVYNASAASPTLYQLFPGAAGPGWFVTCHFSAGGGLSVFLYDDTGALQGTTSYTGVDRNDFGFYIQGPGGTYFSQDGRNPGLSAQVLTFAGSGANFGDWWEAFEDSSVAGGDKDFNDAVLLLQSIAPTPTRGQSWGGLKASYR
jgi:hypothetical protein